MNRKKTIWIVDGLLLTAAIGLLITGKAPAMDENPVSAPENLTAQLDAAPVYGELTLPADMVKNVQPQDLAPVPAARASQVSRGGAVRREEAMTCLGDFRITYYCTGACCNGPWSGQTSTGAPPNPWHTVAVDPNVIPLGTHIYIDGAGEFVAEDVGGAIKGNRIDVLVGDHRQTEALGVDHKKVYVLP